MVTAPGNSRSFESKNFKAVYTLKSTTTFEHFGEDMSISITYGLIVKESYVVNVNTGKISSYGVPSISLVSNYTYDDTEALDLVATTTKAAKFGDYMLKLTLVYHINSTYYYFPFEALTFGPVTKTVYVE